MLSTDKSILCFFAILETALISIIFNIGLVGVSTQINLVFELMHDSIWLIFSIPTK